MMVKVQPVAPVPAPDREAGPRTSIPVKKPIHTPDALPAEYRSRAARIDTESRAASSSQYGDPHRRARILQSAQRTGQHHLQPVGKLEAAATEADIAWRNAIIAAFFGSLGSIRRRPGSGVVRTPSCEAVPTMKSRTRCPAIATSSLPVPIASRSPRTIMIAHPDRRRLSDAERESGKRARRSVVPSYGPPSSLVAPMRPIRKGCSAEQTRFRDPW